MKCQICEKRPARTDKGMCVQCAGKIASASKRRVEPRHFLVYRGNVVGLYPSDGKRLKPQLLRRSAEHMPKRKTINLDTYCEGYSRETIKRFKSCVLQLANA